MRQAKHELDDYYGQVEEELLKLFQMYSAIGDPTNTTKLKSARVMRMFREAGLLKANESMHYKSTSMYQSVIKDSSPVSISSTQLDIIFKKICLHSTDVKQPFLDVSKYQSAAGE